MSAVTLFNDFDPSTVNEASVKHLDTGGKMVWLTHVGGKEAHSTPIILQTGQMRTTSGIRCWENEGAAPKYSMELVLEAGTLEYEKLMEFDQRIVDIACATKNKWIKKATREVLDALYHPSVRVPRDKDTDEVTDKWPVTFKVSLPQRNGGFQCELWDNKRTRLDIPEFISSGAGRNAHVTVITQCTGIWVAGGKFGTTWKAQQILVHSTSSSNLRSFAFIGGDGMVEEADCPHANAKALPAAKAATKPASGAAGGTGAGAANVGNPVGDDEDGEYLDDSE